MLLARTDGGLLLALLLLLDVGTPAAIPPEHDRGRDENRGVRSRDHADEHREREVVYRPVAEDEERGNREERRQRRDDRARQALVDRLVADLGEGDPLLALEKLADAVEHDDRVVDRVADDRQERGDHDERHLAAAQREQAERDERVVREGDQAAEAEAEAEAEADVDQDRHEREQHGLRAGLAEVRADGRPDDLGGLDGELDATEALVAVEGLLDPGLDADRLGALVRRDGELRAWVAAGDDPLDLLDDAGARRRERPALLGGGRLGHLDLHDADGVGLAAIDLGRKVRDEHHAVRVELGELGLRVLRAELVRAGGDVEDDGRARVGREARLQEEVAALALDDHCVVDRLQDAAERLEEAVVLDGGLVALHAVDDRRAAREVDREDAARVGLEPDAEDGEGDEDDHRGGDDRLAAHGHEVDAGRLEELAHPERLAALGRRRVVDYEPRDDNRREHRDDDAAGEHDREAAHRAGADGVEDASGDDRRDVGVEDRGEGARIAVLDGLADRRAALELLADALEDQHVRVDRHAERQHEARDAGHRQDGQLHLRAGHRRVLDERAEDVRDEEERRRQQDHVEEERHVGDHAQVPVVEDHEERDQHEADDRGLNAGADGVAADGGVDLGLGVDLERRRKRARVEVGGESLGINY